MRRSGLPGWAIGLIIVVVLVLVGGAAAFAYMKYFRTAPTAEVVASAPTMSAPVSEPSASAPAASNALAPIESAMEAATATPGNAQAPVPGAPVNAGEGMPQSAPAQQPAPAVETQPSTPAQAAPSQAAPVEQAPPPVDRTVTIAADLVRKGEYAYSQGDYETAVRRAHSALDVRAGYAPAERLLKRAYAAQKQVSEQQARDQQEQAAEQQRAQAAQARAAAAQAAARRPTPDDLYNQRAHSECARGLFGKSCRHKIRVEVCQGVAAGSPGSTVCSELKD